MQSTLPGILTQCARTDVHLAHLSWSQRGGATICLPNRVQVSVGNKYDLENKDFPWHPRFVCMALRRHSAPREGYEMKKYWPIVLDYFLIVVAALIQALSLRLFFIPANLASGGVSGISQLINHFT